MRILDEQDREIQISDIDTEKGYLVAESILKEHHNAVKAKERLSHYYPTAYYFEDGTAYQTTLALAQEEQVLSDNETDGDTIQHENDPRVVKNDDGVSFGYEMDDGSVAQCGDGILRGVDIEEIVDQEACEAAEAWDEYEDIQRYKLYSQEQLEHNATQHAQILKTETQQAQAVVMAQFFARSMSASLSDEELAQVDTLFEDWRSGQEYEKGSVVRYHGGLYKSIAKITGSGTSYAPDEYVAGWKRIGEPDGDGVYPWIQPLGATDCYMLGDIVSYQDKIWVSTIDNNVWVPGVYGWSIKTTSEEGDEETADEYPEWIQPTGAHDAYKIGDKVSYNDKHWVSTIDGNVWAPGVAGWDEE